MLEGSGSKSARRPPLFCEQGRDPFVLLLPESPDPVLKTLAENGVSQVDLPCSGVKSLWTGALFLIAATWIERRPLNLRWLGVAGIFGGLLLAANLARVAVLVLVGQVAGWPLAAEMIHVPLGVLGFVAACAAAVMLMRWQFEMSANSSRLNCNCQSLQLIIS